jgi:hypothetical protein
MIMIMDWLKKNIVWVMLGGVVLLFLLNLSLVLFIKDSTWRGTFGDQFGAVNALFSGLAFAGLIYTIILQRRDLKLQRNDLRLQRKELALTRKEMEDQTAEFEKQNETLRIQRFENTFFNMLSQFQEVVNNLSVPAHVNGENALLTGRDVFYELFERKVLNVRSPQNRDVWYSCRGVGGLLAKLGVEGYMQSEVPTQFDHYFRLLYRILKFVKTSPLITKFEDEYEYTSILRATLSRYELVWLYYNGLTYGKNKLKPLIERYAMLKNLRKDLLVDGVNCEEYAESAYRKTNP